MPLIELIALDLDGTALTPDGTVSHATRQAVRRARAAGLRVVVSTGRIGGEAREFAAQLDADDLMVTSGGATLSSAATGRCTMRMSMPWEAAVQVAAVVERIGMTAMIYAGERLLITPYDDLGFGRYKSNEGYLAVKQVVPSVAEHIAAHHLSVDKVFVRSQDPITLANARARIEQIAGVRVMSSAADNLEVVTPAADKGTALGMLCRTLGTDLSRAAAIGDSENDLEMLRAVALPIAMGNATDAVKAVCRRVTLTNAQDGVAAAIGQILAENDRSR
ncbi:MAG: Cof-type HAD-IIB family hydrolase [Eubacteriales bacterium]|nr:Cof-type HAD-IIB family hydrolase [Eubacteriales bacterium]